MVRIAQPLISVKWKGLLTFLRIQLVSLCWLLFSDSSAISPVQLFYIGIEFAARRYSLLIAAPAMYIKEQFTPTRWLHIFQSAVSLKSSSIGMSKTCRKSRRWEGTVLHSMPSNHQKNGFTMKRKATAISMNGINRRTAEFYVASNNKSYYHCFTTINFAKPSWRALHSMIPSIANPTELVGAMPLHLAAQDRSAA